MKSIQKRIASAIAAASILGNVALPVFAETTIQISGNGAGSSNFATVNQTSNTTVTQDNTANVTNNVSANASTGSNSSNFNTGGSTVIDTGNATTEVNVENMLNANVANVDCCAAGDTDVLIEDNGAFSTNTVALDQESEVEVNQDNRAYVDNNVYANAKTGYNNAGWNTGGDTIIATGNATTDVNVSTQANANVAYVSGSEETPTVDLRIVGNGALSDNFINADLAKYTLVNQDNYADVENDVDANAKTGNNDAEFNTGGLVVIDTGEADASVAVDNMVNFNVADVDCGCTWDVFAKIDGNGADAPYFLGESRSFGFPWFKHHKKGDNVINLDLTSDLAYLQDNRAYLDNDVDANAKTGYNEAGWNGGDSDSDPVVLTGDAYDSVLVENSGNANVIGNPMFDLPEFDWDWNMNFGHDLSAFIGFMGYMLS